MRFVKPALFILFISLFNFVFARSAAASLVTVKSDGEMVVNVLADETTSLDVPKNDLVAVKDAITGSSNGSQIALAKKDGKVQLSVSGDNGSKNLDVTNYKENVIEIEERPQTQKISIRVEGDKFLIKQRGITATTDYEINVDPKTAGLTLKTPSGLQFLSVLPKEAVDTVMRSQLINQIALNEVIDLNEENGQLTYTVTGDRMFNIFDFFDYPLSVTTKVSASTGKIISIEDPKWLRFAAFLFV